MQNIVIILLLLILIVRRQLRHRPIKGDQFFLPLLGIVYGVYLAMQASIEIGEGFSLQLGAAMGLAVGWIQGRFTNVYQQNGIWMEAGSIVTLAIWLLSVPIRFLIKFAYLNLFEIPVHLVDSYAVVPYLFSFAGILVGKALFLTIRYPHQVSEASRTTRRERRAVR